MLWTTKVGYLNYTHIDNMRLKQIYRRNNYNHHDPTYRQFCIAGIPLPHSMHIVCTCECMTCVVCSGGLRLASGLSFGGACCCMSAYMYSRWEVKSCSHVAWCCHVTAFFPSCSLFLELCLLWDVSDCAHYYYGMLGGGGRG